MIKKLMTAVMGSRQERDVKKMRPILAQIQSHEERLGAVTDDELRGQTAKFRAIIEERTGELARELAAVRARKHDSADPT